MIDNLKYQQENLQELLHAHSINGDRKQIYRLYLNGRLYGGGNWSYMQELMNDWVNSCDMYGYDTVEFKVERYSKRSRD
jgi:hypothetical protein